MVPRIKGSCGSGTTGTRMSTHEVKGKGVGVGVGSNRSRVSRKFRIGLI